MAVYKRDMVDINLETGNIHRSFLKHSIGYKDAAADHFGIRVFRNGEPVNLTGVSVQGIFMPPQGSPIAITSGNIVSENEAEVVLPQACYNYDGQFTLAIKLVDSTNEVTGTVRIVDGMVDNTHASGTVAPTSAVPTYQEVLSAYEQAIAAINKTVRFDATQSLTDTQKATARSNISAASASELQAEATARATADTTLQGNIDAEANTRAAADADLKSALINDADALCVTVESITTTLNSASSINPATGGNGTGIVGCRSGYISYSKPMLIKLDLPDYQCTVWTYTTNSTSNTSYSPTGTTFVDGVRTVFLKPITGANPCYRIGLKRYDGQAIPSTDHATILSKISFYTMTDTTLAKSGYPADSKATGDRIGTVSTAESEIRSQVFKYNSIDAFDFGNGTGGSNNGITFTKNADGTWTLDGTATDSAVNSIINSPSLVPNYIVKGKTYVLKFDSTIVPIRFYFYYSDSSRNNHFTVTENDKEVTIPSDIIGLIARFQISSGTVFDNDIIGVHFLSELSSGGTTIYNITVEPEITTDNHNWLEATGDTTDMASAIVAMLTETGYCKLSPGVFYVGGSLDVPTGATLEGCGRDTVIRLLSSVTSGYAVKIKNYATIKDLYISGSSSTLTPSGDIGTRHGILFEAAYGLESGNETSHCMVNNVWIENFTGAGIKCYRTSINYAKGLYVEQAFINRCHTGIDIELLSEFNKFVNVCIARCYNACVNNGGNNVFTSCTFHATNIGFLMDDTDGTHGNNGHGTMTACTFCHIGSNTGSAITARNIKNGFSFSACQVWYNSIDLTDCDGFVFSAFEFGKGINTNKGASININGGNTIMFVGCVFMNDVENPPEISITNNTKVKFNNCYGSASGNAITGS